MKLSMSWILTLKFRTRKIMWSRAKCFSNDNIRRSIIQVIQCILIARIKTHIIITRPFFHLARKKKNVFKNSSKGDMVSVLRHVSTDHMGWPINPVRLCFAKIDSNFWISIVKSFIIMWRKIQIITFVLHTSSISSEAELNWTLILFFPSPISKGLSGHQNNESDMLAFSFSDFLRISTSDWADLFTECVLFPILYCMI